MAVQNSVAVRNAMLDAQEVAIGPAPRLQLRTGAQPASCASPATGTLLCEITLPSDWMAAASTGAKAKLGTWQGTGEAAAGAGTAAGHYRIVDSAGTTCHEQGSVLVRMPLLGTVPHHGVEVDLPKPYGRIGGR